MGSQIEGTTTLGLESDIDTLFYKEHEHIIQDMSELKQGVINYLMIQNDKISSGYCYLQLINGNLHETESDKYEIRDRKTLLKNTHLKVISTIYPKYLISNVFINGPALTFQGVPGIILSNDHIFGIFGESLPYQVLEWLQKQKQHKWPATDILEQCMKSGCLVVGVASKNSDNPNLEWRISTHLQERCIMRSISITQTRCYILMKFYLQTYINPQVKGVLSSYMCKNVFLYCIADSPHDWNSETLLPHLRDGLTRLKTCVIERNCPHFILQKKNLLAGRVTESQRSKILEIIKSLEGNDDQLLFGMEIDDLGKRLKIKLNMIPHCSDMFSKSKISRYISDQIVQVLTSFLRYTEHCFAVENEHKHIDDMLFSYSQANFNPVKLSRSNDTDLFPYIDTEVLHVACRLLIRLLSSTLGLLFVSGDIAYCNALTDRAIYYLEDGKNSDALSGKLKLVTALYCSGDLFALDNMLELDLLDLSSMTPMCSHINKPPNTTVDFMESCDKYEDSENVIKNNAALCTIFQRTEINCVPRELQ